MILGILDLWQQNNDAQDSFHPGEEGTTLPGWWEFHGHDVMVLSAVLAAIALVAGLVVMRWRVFNLFIAALAEVVRAWRQARRAADALKSAVLKRADER